MSVKLSMYVRMNARMHECMHVCMYICIHVAINAMHIALLSPGINYDYMLQFIRTCSKNKYFTHVKNFSFSFYCNRQ